ncbi:MAG: UvrD-helicase domain-containing protein [bacterium]|nr:UvrD-helicase domain-containing protein [bacterium]
MASEDINNAITPEQDEKARNEACDPTRSYIVQAPAGSGKTSLLTLRFLNLLTTVDFPEQIIAITFTRKAAAEMRERILGELNKASLNEEFDDTDDYKTNLRKSAQNVLARNNEKKWRLLDQPNRLRICTIDSLCLQLSKQMPITSEFGAALEPTDDAAELYSEAAGNTIAYLESSLPDMLPGPEEQEAYKILAGHCNNNTAYLAESLAQLLAIREKWLPLLEKYEKGNDFIDKSRIAAEQLAVKLMAEANKLLFPYTQELAKIGSFALKKGSEENYYKELDKLNRHESTCELKHLKAWGELIDLITTPGHDKLRATTRLLIPFSISDNDKKELKNIISQFSFNEDSLSELALLAELSNAIPSETAEPVIKAIFTLLRPALDQLKKVFGEKKSCDHSEFSINARKALRDLGTGLGEKLDYKIKHILIDEYQDTSWAQYDLAYLLTQDWTPCQDAKEAEGRTIFMVGDPMQSIYRFRNAEVGVYLYTKEHGLHDLEEKDSIRIMPDKLQLSHNFRSAENTIQIFNGFFKGLFSAQDDESAGAIKFAQATVPSDKNGEPKNEMAEPKDLEDYELDEQGDYFNGSKENGLDTPAIIASADNDAKEAEMLIKIINRELEDNKGNDKFRLAVLVRTRSAIVSLIPYFEKAGISFQAVEIHKLSAKTIISDLMSLTKAIINPGDKIALLSLLRSPWCGLTLKELHAITGANPLDMPNLNNPDNIGTEVRDRIKLLKDVLQSSYSARAYMSLRNLTEAAWIKLGGPAISQETDLNQAKLYFSALAKLENEKTLVLPEDIDQAIEKLFALPDFAEEAQKVQIMTIHKAKGLEFDTIILPGVHKQGNNAKFSLLNFMDTEEGLLIGLTQKAPAGNNLAQYFIKSIDKKKEANELQRLLYVALTRAKKHIFITGQKIKQNDKEEINPNKNSLLNLLFKNNNSEIIFTKKEKDESANKPLEEIEERKLPELPYIVGWDFSSEHNQASIPVSLDAPEPETPSDWQEKWAKYMNDKRSDTSIAIGEIPYLGTVVHLFFALIAEEGLDNWNKKRLDDCKTAIKNSLISLGTNPAIADEHAEHVLNVLKDSLESKRARWILGVHEQAACEMRMTGPLGDNEDLIDETKDNDKNRIIDRTFVDNGIRWIIDYKTGQRTAGESDDKFAKRKLDGRIGAHQTYREQLNSYATLLKNAGEKLPIKLALYFPFTNADKTSRNPMEMFIEWEPGKTEFSINPSL